MVERIQVKPELIRWARERLGRDVDDFGARFKRLAAWESGEAQPTFRQLKDYAQATHVPLGYFFLPEPPIERLPMTDLRTLDNQWLSRPSPNLLDTIYVMQRRQDWLREEMIACEAEPLDFVGSAAISDSPLGVGREMRRIIGFEEGWAAMVNTWQEAVSILRLAMEKIGVIAFINGVVGNNTKRTLNVEEFRGFALCDEYAPLIFVNGADSKSAQMFTLAHELAHIWLGESALSDVHLGVYPTQDIEIWCNKAAAEFLVPENELRECWQSVKHEGSPFDSLARRFKVSPIVAGRRAMELRLVDRATFFDFYRDYIKREKRHRAGSKGGNFYNTQSIRLGEHFPLTVFYAAKEGRVSFKEAYDLTGLHAGAFQEYAYRLGVMLP
ncbi:MAG: ImmA/IrrE family metallo-endopeptidase [Rhodoferax sp.]|nr:ImmA/IrrE family metallo-endopeptidase [Rhodoferax sp.]